MTICVTRLFEAHGKLSNLSCPNAPTAIARCGNRYARLGCLLLGIKGPYRQGADSMRSDRGLGSRIFRLFEIGISGSGFDSLGGSNGHKG